MLSRIRDWFRTNQIATAEWDERARRLRITACRLRVEPMFAWYDIWVGVFVDVERKRVYVFPVPMFGFKIYWG